MIELFARDCTCKKVLKEFRREFCCGTKYTIYDKRNFECVFHFISKLFSWKICLIDILWEPQVALPYEMDRSSRLTLTWWKHTILKLLDLFPRLISDTSQYAYCKDILIHITIYYYSAK